MSFTHVVVDGSNLATEGRSIPSLAQLDEAVREFNAEFPQAEITVVVDATFGHRIDPFERPAFDEAQAHGELVSPPAGAIGRGDAFLLRIADRSGATVLSNDSFQEFHGDYEWLFTRDRLIGGKPVPGIGWIFTPRNPVRGPKSRESMREAKKTSVRVGSKEASRPMPVPKAPPPRPGVSTGTGRPKAGLSDAIAAATEEIVSPEAPGSTAAGGRRRRRRGTTPSPEAVNDPLTFIQFIANHPLGSQFEGDVESFASHGCFVDVDGARCYLPLSGMGDPPPRSAREVLGRVVRHTFALQALDPQRRGIELALPGFARVAGSPQQETVDAEIARTRPSASTRRRRGRGPVTEDAGVAADAGMAANADMTANAGVAADADAIAADDRPAVEGSVTEVPAQKTSAGKTSAKKAPAKKAPVVKAPAVKAAPRKVAAPAERGPVKKVAAPARKAPAKKTAVKDVVAPADKVAAPAKKAPAPAKKAAAPAKKAPATKTAAKKAPAPAKKAGPKKAGPKNAGAAGETSPRRVPGLD